MEAKIFVIAFPTMETVVEKISSLFEDAFEPKRTKCCEKSNRINKDLTPCKFKVNKPCGNVQPWGVGGAPADENLRFGYGLEVDEPMYQHYDDDCEFLKARKAFDDFVEAGEHCRKLGLEKTCNSPITKCNAIRKPIGCPPPMNQDLLGESQFPWWEIDMGWDF